MLKLIGKKKFTLKIFVYLNMCNNDNIPEDPQVYTMYLVTVLAVTVSLAHLPSSSQTVQRNNNANIPEDPQVYTMYLVTVLAVTVSLAHPLSSSQTVQRNNNDNLPEDPQV